MPPPDLGLVPPELPRLRRLSVSPAAGPDPLATPAASDFLGGAPLPALREYESGPASPDGGKRGPAGRHRMLHIEVPETDSTEITIVNGMSPLPHWPVPVPVPEHADQHVSDKAFNACLRKGHRRHMEDAYCASPNMPAGRKFFAVLDGHGNSGRVVALQAAAHMARLAHTLPDCPPEEARQKLEDMFQDTHTQCAGAAAAGGGTTCVAALLNAPSRTLVVANAGDCRAVLCRAGKAVALSVDHRPDNPSEKQRIESAGGTLLEHGGSLRVLGALAVTRSLGDIRLKQYGVTATPEVTTACIEPADLFLVLASDGVWCKLGNQEVVDIVLGCRDRDRAQASVLVAEAALNAGSTDNVCVLVVWLDELRSGQS